MDSLSSLSTNSTKNSNTDNSDNINIWSPKTHIERLSKDTKNMESSFNSTNALEKSTLHSADTLSSKSIGASHLFLRASALNTVNQKIDSTTKEIVGLEKVLNSNVLNEDSKKFITTLIAQKKSNLIHDLSLSQNQKYESPKWFSTSSSSLDQSPLPPVRHKENISAIIMAQSKVDDTNSDTSENNPFLMPLPLTAHNSFRENFSNTKEASRVLRAKSDLIASSRSL